MLQNALEGKPLPVYGDGGNVRDWLYVRDHCRAVWMIMTSGRPGETYNIGGECELTNLSIVERICGLVDGRRGGRGPSAMELLSFVKDRPGHDFRYAIDCSKLKTELGWRPEETFDSGLARTVSWYLDNPGWVRRVRSGEYLDWIDTHYRKHGQGSLVRGREEKQ